ncbi:MAG: ABC transporter ATP-binding protein [Desulfurococcales archaeon]|nr:ABC transporter ATP-binding protein [Desulfurococcales archaeon]
MAEPILEVLDLKVYFSVKKGIFSSTKSLVRAVDGVTFSMKEGDILTIVGESGCGKTTLGKAVAGLVKPSSGKILFYGKDIYSMDKKEYMNYRRNVQMIHQDPYASLNPVKTVYKILSTPLLRWGIVSGEEEARRRALDLLEIVGLTPPDYFINKYPHQLSGGQRQRLIVARAISVEPKIIVADEPITMIDVSLRLGILDLLLDLRKKMGLTVIFITHDFGAARYFSAKGGGDIAVMYLGKIVEKGPAESVIQEPLHPYTKTLIAAVPEPDPKYSRTKERIRLRSLDIPSPINPPPGCRFHTRCPLYMEVCSEREPPLVQLTNDREVSCFLYTEFSEKKA